jgi:hypothetical protein
MTAKVLLVSYYKHRKLPHTKVDLKDTKTRFTKHWLEKPVGLHCGEDSVPVTNEAGSVTKWVPNFPRHIFPRNVGSQWPFYAASHQKMEYSDG